MPNEVGIETYINVRSYHALIESLDHIMSNDEHVWDGKTITKANGLLSNIISPSFIAVFQVNLCIWGGGVHQATKNSSPKFNNGYPYCISRDKNSENFRNKLR